MVSPPGEEPAVELVDEVQFQVQVEAQPRGDPFVYLQDAAVFGEIEPRKILLVLHALLSALWRKRLSEIVFGQVERGLLTGRVVRAFFLWQSAK